MIVNPQVPSTGSWRSGRLLPLVLLLSFAIAVWMGLYALVSLRTVLVQEKGSELAGTAVQVADTLDRVLFERFGDIQLFANDRILIEGDQEERTKRLQEYRKLYWYYSWIGIADATGHVVATINEPATHKNNVGTNEHSAETGPDLSRTDWFDTVRRTGQVHLEEAQRSPESGGVMTVGFAAPMYGPRGDFRGMVGSRVPLENLRSILQQEGSRKQGEDAYDWLLLDRQGTVVLEKGQTTGMNSTLSAMELPSIRRAAEDRDTPGFAEELHQRRRIPVVTGYARTRGYGSFPGFDWTVLVRMDRDRAYAPINRLIWTVSGVGLLLVTPLVGFGVWVSWRLGREHRDLVRAQESLEGSNAELARSNADLQQFAYVASHDLQEPLRMIASYTQLLARRYKGKLDADADDFIGYAVDGATRMQRLINDLLTYSRVTTQGKIFERVDCNQLLDGVLTNLRLAVEENRAVVTHDALPVVTADGGQLGQLFQNLIGNAIKFHGEEPPRVHVSVELRNNEWQFSVRDNGIGVDPQYAERIFVIFQRLHNREDYPGTGIGLALCKKIVERHGGRIWVESPIGRGAVFYFTLPVIGHEQNESGS
ncbi:sensor histidine kinase [Nitrospira sp. NS4]|uniref:sensor histidine kinase n=1 Tax=Nitrospira sp. NS4 TaxID=3414498 RepID=UPI003C30826D